MIFYRNLETKLEPIAGRGRLTYQKTQKKLIELVGGDQAKVRKKSLHPQSMGSEATT
jgi:hypothetical protein